MMEKFKLTDANGEQSRFFINNAGIDPTRNLQGGLNSSASGSDGIGTSKAFGYNYNTNSNPYKDLSNITGNGITKGSSVSYDSERDEVEDLKANSEISKREGIKSSENDKKIAIGDDPNITRLNSTVSGYSKDDRRGESDIGGDFANVFKTTGQFAIQKVKTARDKLINDTLQNIRTSTGLKRINRPHNVYDDNFSVGGFFRNQLSNFTNDQVTDFISGLGN